MKQYISKKEWDELTKEEKKEFEKSMREGEGRISSFDEHYGAPTIGQMIEFLGQDELDDCLFSIGGVIPKEEICDALWNACKNKLKTHETIQMVQ